jgi:hypothetical protein
MRYDTNITTDDRNTIIALTQDNEFLGRMVEVLLISGVHEVVWHKTPRARLGQHSGPVTTSHMARGLIRAMNHPEFHFFKDGIIDREPTSEAASLVWLSSFPNSATAKRELNGGV